jgi:hypothetical protein
MAARGSIALPNAGIITGMNLNPVLTLLSGKVAPKPIAARIGNNAE